MNLLLQKWELWEELEDFIHYSKQVLTADTN